MKKMLWLLVFLPFGNEVVSWAVVTVLGLAFVWWVISSIINDMEGANVRDRDY